MVPELLCCALSLSLGNGNVGVVLWYLSGLLSNGRKVVSLGSPPVQQMTTAGLRGQGKDRGVSLQHMLLWLYLTAAARPV